MPNNIPCRWCRTMKSGPWNREHDMHAGCATVWEDAGRPPVEDVAGREQFLKDNALAIIAQLEQRIRNQSKELHRLGQRTRWDRATEMLRQWAAYHETMRPEWEIRSVATKTYQCSILWWNQEGHIRQSQRYIADSPAEAAELAMAAFNKLNHKETQS